MAQPQGMDNVGGGQNNVSGRLRTVKGPGVFLRFNRVPRINLLSRPYRLLNTPIGNPLPSSSNRVKQKG